MNTHPVRGMDHVGITIADIEQATRFFKEAFGAEVIYDSVKRSDEDVKGPDQESHLHLFPGTIIKAVRMLRLRNGPGLELFEMQGPEQGGPVRPSDYGIQHFAVYVDDINEAVHLFEQAGGTMFSEPLPLKFPPEIGEGNAFCYGRTPWGSVIELITTPSAMPYERQTGLRRWKPVK